MICFFLLAKKSSGPAGEGIEKLAAKMICFNGRKSDHNKSITHFQKTHTYWQIAVYVEETYHAFIRIFKINIWMNPPCSYCLQGDTNWCQQSTKSCYSIFGINNNYQVQSCTEVQENNNDNIEELICNKNIDKVTLRVIHSIYYLNDTSFCKLRYTIICVTETWD